MTDSPHPQSDLDRDDITALLEPHSELPTVTPTDTLTRSGQYVFIIHGVRDVTRVTFTDDFTEIAAIATITDTVPDRITPADEVIGYGRITRIIHGPGRSTFILNP